jgi:hypothetical protein
VSSSMLRGDSEIECLLEDVIEDGLDDDCDTLKIPSLKNYLATVN